MNIRNIFGFYTWLTEDVRTSYRRAFIETCHRQTRQIHRPIANLARVRGHLNPRGLGHAKRFSRRGQLGQSSVAYKLLADFRRADKAGHSAEYGGAEYGVVQSPEADDVCKKIAALHNGKGAIICPSGLSAITTTINAFRPHMILLPDNVYSPTKRYVEEKNIEHVYYPAGASAAEVEKILAQALRQHGSDNVMMYIEAPGSGTFEIPDIKGLADLARKNGVRSVMDNTYASHVRFKPLDHNVDIVIQATTKYEGGYGDTPSGVVIAGNEKDLESLQYELRISGNGAISPATCTRLSHRIDSTEERLDQHYATALKLMEWFSKQDFVDRILCPALETSPDNERFQEYFGKGNGLFSIVFRPDIPAAKVEEFTDALNLFLVAESWGGHVSLVLPVEPKGRLSPLPEGTIMRFHAGLEDYRDLLRDLERAAERTFGPVLDAREFMEPSSRRSLEIANIM